MLLKLIHFGNFIQENAPIILIQQRHLKSMCASYLFFFPKRCVVPRGANFTPRPPSHHLVVSLMRRSLRSPMRVTGKTSRVSVDCQDCGAFGRLPVTCSLRLSLILCHSNAADTLLLLLFLFFGNVLKTQPFPQSASPSQCTLFTPPTLNIFSYICVTSSECSPHSFGPGHFGLFVVRTCPKSHLTRP